VVLSPIIDLSAARVLARPTTNSFTPTSDIPDGDYLWTVAASSRTCESGPVAKLFTIPGNCPLSTPTLLSPADFTIVNNPVQFRWSSVPGASLYALYVGDASTGEPVIQESLVSTPEFTTTLPRGVYFWIVNGWNSTCDLGPTSSPSWFAIP
jgi:hypothetical protein